MTRTAAPVLASLHIYPLKSVQGHAPREAAVQPWGFAGDRRWMLIDSADRVITQRSRPGLALITAQLLPSGGLRLTAPGREALTVAVPGPPAAEGIGTVAAELFRDRIEVVPAANPAAHAWFSACLGMDARLVHLDDPARRRAIDPEYAHPGETVSLADGYPMLLTSLSSLTALNSLISEGRHADEGPLPMNRFRPNIVVDGSAPWAEDDWRRIAVGEVTFRVVKKCARCVVTTTDQRTAGRGKEPLHTLGLHRRIEHGLLFGQNLIPESAGTVRVGDPVRVLDVHGAPHALEQADGFPAVRGGPHGRRTGAPVREPARRVRPFSS